MAFFRFSNHTVKLRTPDQPQSAVSWKSFDTWYYMVTCATLCVSFLSKLEAINVFPKHILNQNWKQVEREIKEQATQLTLLYRGRTVRSSQQSCCIRKLFLKILQYPQETSVLESIFKKAANLSTCNFI